MRARTARSLRRALCLTVTMLLAASIPRVVSAGTVARPHGLPADLTALSLEELMGIEVESVYGASRFLQKATDAPASVSVVTNEEIRAHGYRTLAEALRSVRGVFVTSDRNYDYLGVRGFGRADDYNARVLVLVDGHRINDNLYEGALVGTDFPVDLDLVERVEVIRGPSSSVYGPNAFLGVVNVVTRSGGEMNGLRAAAGLGNFGTEAGRVSFGGRTAAGLDLLLSGTLYASDGERHLYYREYDDAAGHDGWAHECDRDRSGQLFARFGLGDVTLRGVYGSRRKLVPTGAWFTVFDDPRNETLDQRGYVDLGWHRRLGRESEVTARLAYDDYRYVGGYATDESAEGESLVVLNKDDAHGRWWSGEVNARCARIGRHTLIVGSEFRNNVAQDQRNYDEAPYVVYQDDHRSSRGWALYAEDDVELHERVRLSAGVRYDHYSIFRASTHPRLGLLYSPSPGTSLKALYGSAFRIPTIYELYFGGEGYDPNPNLRPETIGTWELAWDSYLLEHYHVAASLFRYRVRHLIREWANPDDGAVLFRNGGDVTSDGAEIELVGRWAGGLEGRLAYATQFTENGETGAALVNSPRHLAQSAAIVPLPGRRLRAGFELQFMGRRRTLAREWAAAHALANLTLSGRDRGERWEATGGVYNLADTRYSDPGSLEHTQDQIQQPGRSLRLTIRVRI
jgi:outer membrane receptor for ferrienterochelin and colicins